MKKTKLLSLVTLAFLSTNLFANTIETYTGTGIEEYASVVCKIQIIKNTDGEIESIQGDAIGEPSFPQTNEHAQFDVSLESKKTEISQLIFSEGYKLTHSTNMDTVIDKQVVSVYTTNEKPVKLVYSRKARAFGFIPFGAGNAKGTCANLKPVEAAE